MLESDEQEGSPAGAWSGKLRLEGRETAATEDLASNTEKGSCVRSRGIQERGWWGRRTLKQLGPSRVQAEAEVCCEVCGGNASPTHFRLVQRCCQAKAPGTRLGED